MEDIPAILFLWIVPMLFGCLFTVVVQTCFKRCRGWFDRGPLGSNNANNKKIGAGPKVKKTEENLLSNSSFFVGPSGRCIHKSRNCCGMNTPHELYLCTKCFG